MTSLARIRRPRIAAMLALAGCGPSVTAAASAPSAPSSSTSPPAAELAPPPGGPAAAAPVLMSGDPPPGAPTFAAPAWRPLAGTLVRCAGVTGGDPTCVAVELPAPGFLAVDGTSSHTHGCLDLGGGVIEAQVDPATATIALSMTLPGRGAGGGLCRALAVLHGRGMFGPLAAGTWILHPTGPGLGRVGPYGPLHLADPRFAPAPPGR